MFNSTFAIISRFIPEPLVIVLREKAGNASLQILDAVCEHPEMIWTAEMQGELRHALQDLLANSNSSSGATKTASSAAVEEDPESFSAPPLLPPEYAVKYRQIAGEIFVGGVYIRLYLKQPTFRLSNAVFFLEKLVEFWDSSFNIQVPLQNANSKIGAFSVDHASDSRAVVLGNEDFLSLLTSCMVCVIKGESSVIEHLITWGFVHTLPGLLQRALRAGRRGTPMVSVVRLLFQLTTRSEVVDNLASAKVDPIEQLTLALQEGDTVPKDATIVVELLKRIFQTPYCRFMDQFVAMALRVNLPSVLLNKILGATKENLAHVANASALRIHTVDCLKAILAAGDPAALAQLQALLDLHPAWREFKHQSHDLFLTVNSVVLFSFVDVCFKIVFPFLILGQRESGCIFDSRCQ